MNALVLLIVVHGYFMEDSCSNSAFDSHCYETFTTAWLFHEIQKLAETITTNVFICQN